MDETALKVAIAGQVRVGAHGRGFMMMGLT
jgi:hypothetical protein